MRVKILRNLGAALLAELGKDGTKIPDQPEGKEADISDDAAKTLIEQGLAEPAGVKNEAKPKTPETK